MAGRLVFAVNGERFELAKVDPSTTLIEFLRTRTRFTGPKLGCGEGGCGACVVLLSKYDPVCDKVEEFSVSSCLTLVCNINFCSITTSEGLGNSKDGFHSIHQRFAGFHASQCGFCTPGMCMSLFSALTNADRSSRPEPPNGFSKITKLEAAKAIAGNLCRCTGYRPIADACKSFAADADLEDLGLNTFWKKGEEDVNVNRLPKYSQGKICTFPEFLKCEIKSSTDNLDKSKIRSLPDCQWYRPTSIEELYELLNSDVFVKSQTKLVVGNTGSGVYKEHDLFDKYVDLKGIPELSVVRRENGGISFGAAITISTAIQVLKEKHEGMLHSDGAMVFSKIADHMDKVASQFVRNMGSLGGNLIMAQRHQFASDIATILLAAGSTVCLQMASERLVLSLEEFLERPPCDDRTILISIHIPSWSSSMELSSETGNYIVSGPTRKSKILFETYRASPRPLGNAVAYLNCAFLAHVIPDKISGDLVLHNLCLAFGAYGTEHAIRARKVEKFLVGKLLTASVLLEAIEVLKETIIPKEGTPHSSYRSSLAVAFLFKFFQPLAKDLSLAEKNFGVDSSVVSSIAKYPNGNANGYADFLPHHASNFEQLSSPKSNLVLSSEQLVEFNNDYYPVGQPIKKAGAEIQASGEAMYVDDFPSPKDCLYGAFVYSTRPLAHIKGITFNSSLASKKVIEYISFNDIPKGGTNVGAIFFFGAEPLFAESLTECAGQALGIVVAETQRYANMAAKQANVQYLTENLEPPILSVEDAVRRSSFFNVPPKIAPQKVGDLSEGMAKAEHKILSAEVKLGGQYFFYMETQTALAIPEEDNCVVVHSSNQYPEAAQGVIAKCLGIPEHNVRVITRRVGGGFGGKAVRALHVATACALAAFKMRRPVRMYLDRKTDMVMMGGRHPMKINYSVGFMSDGKITALHLDILINAGIAEDASSIIPISLVGSLKKYNWGALSFDIKLCKTNLVSKTAMRAPGEVQGSFIAEAVIEHVASFLSTDTNSVRSKNLHTYESLKLFYGDSAGDAAAAYTLPAIVHELTSSAGYFSRLETIRHFNNCNKWVKRGISWVPLVYQVTVRATPGKVSILNDGSIAVEVGGIELGQGLWTKVKQTTAFALGQLYDDRSENLLDRVRIIQADTLSLIQGGMTAGSTTSESSCEAVHLCCSILVSRLKSLKQSLEEEMGSTSWDTLISQAILRSVNLSASTYWVPDSDSETYLNFGVGMSEVEVDILTGATTILRTDLIYDCGQSLNPAVDMGQIEGSFVQGIGFFMREEVVENSDGLVVSDGTWTYKIPTVDTIPKQFNVKLLKSGHHKNRFLSSKASGEPPLVLAASVHCATREAIRACRTEFLSPSGDSNGSVSSFPFNVPATMPVVKELCGLGNVEKYLKTFVSTCREVEA